MHLSLGRPKPWGAEGALLPSPPCTSPKSLAWVERCNAHRSAVRGAEAQGRTGCGWEGTCVSSGNLQRPGRVCNSPPAAGLAWDSHIWGLLSPTAARTAPSAHVLPARALLLWPVTLGQEISCHLSQAGDISIRQPLVTARCGSPECHLGTKATTGSEFASWRMWCRKRPLSPGSWRRGSVGSAPRKAQGGCGLCIPTGEQTGAGPTMFRSARRFY